MAPYEAPILVAPQELSGGQVRSAVARLEALPFDPADSEPIWLSSLSPECSRRFGPLRWEARQRVRDHEVLTIGVLP